MTVEHLPAVGQHVLVCVVVHGVGVPAVWSLCGVHQRVVVNVVIRIGQGVERGVEGPATRTSVTQWVGRHGETAEVHLPHLVLGFEHKATKEILPHVATGLHQAVVGLGGFTSGPRPRAGSDPEAVRIRVVLGRFDLHFPTVEHAVGVGVVDEWVRGLLEGTRHEENLIAVFQTVIVGVRVVGVGQEVVLTGDDFFAVFQAVVVGIKHTRVGKVGLAFPRESRKSLGLIAETVAVRVGVRSV